MGRKKQNLLFVFYFDFFVVDVAYFSLSYVYQWGPIEGHCNALKIR